MYNDVVAPECFLPRNIRENFATDPRETFLRLSEVENKEERNVRINSSRTIGLTVYFSRFFRATGNSRGEFRRKFYLTKRKIEILLNVN